MDAPKRAVELKIEIEADDWEAVARVLEQLRFRVISHGPIESTISGGWDSGYMAQGKETDGQTGDKYRAELDRYVETLSKQGEGIDYSNRSA